LPPSRIRIIRTPAITTLARQYTTDYNLNTTTGNRPARLAIGPTKVITPLSFGGLTPAKGEVYRVALARYVTGDFQFAGDG